MPRLVAAALPCGSLVLPLPGGGWAVESPGGSPVRDGRTGGVVRFPSAEDAVRVAELIGGTPGGER